MDRSFRKQKQKLLQLRDAVVDSMAGVAQAPFARALKAASFCSACTRLTPIGRIDRDFALSLLSQDRSALRNREG